MYGSILLTNGAGKYEKGSLTRLGEKGGRNEAWLRDLLFSTPEIIPVEDIDPGFGPLVPLCRELRTEAGSIDAAFINKLGRLTIVECKLWRNPQARREVVAQSLHYVSAIARWTYADLQRQVAAALGRHGNLPYEIARNHSSALREQDFVDDVSRSLRDGRVLVLIAGDGIREGMESLTQLVSSNATKAFSFGIIEVASYQFPGGRIAIQPRILAQTSLITRQVTLISTSNGASIQEVIDESDIPASDAGAGPSRGKGRHKAWWQPLLRMRFDDPDQEPPRWLGTNNLALPTPFPGILIKAFALVDDPRAGIFISGTRSGNTDAIRGFIRREKDELQKTLPAGTEINGTSGSIHLETDQFDKTPDRIEWLRNNLNSFVTALRPRLRKWYEETQR